MMDSSMLKVGGQYFRCVCGANVFHKGVKPGLWICNGCGAEYTDENYDHRKSNADRIRAMNDHDLAVFLEHAMYDSSEPDWMTVLSWLQQPAEEET